MNNNVRVAIEVVLAIALVVAIVLFFNQSNTLTETEDALSSAQSAGTTVAENAAAASTQGAMELSDAQASASQAADYAAATSTQAAMELSDAQASATQAANDADDAAAQAADDAAATSTQAAMELDEANDDATSAARTASANQENAEATGTQSALDFSDEIENLEGTAAQNASNFAELEETATQAASDAANAADESAEELSSQATQFAEEMADADATIDAVNSELDNALEVAATISAQLSDAQDEIDEQATTIAQADEPIATPVVNDIDLDDFDLVTHETDDISLAVPDTYFVVDIEEDVDDNLDEINDMGDEYEFISIVYEDNADFYIFFAFPDNANSFVIEYISVGRIEIDADFDFDMQDYLDFREEDLSEDTDVLESDVVEINGEDVGLFVIGINLENITLVQVQYVFYIDDNLYLLTFFTVEDFYDSAAEELFEAIANTFEVLD